MSGAAGERGRDLTGRQFLERYGVTLAIVVTLAVVLALLPSNVRRQAAVSGRGPLSGAQPVGPSPSSAPSGGGGGESGPAVAPGSPGATSVSGSAGFAGGVVSGGGRAGTVIFGKGVCRADGRQAGISIYMPPCVELLGPNGGATWRGVSANTIKVVRWIGRQDPGTQAILVQAKIADAESVRSRAYQALTTYSNQHYYTYGRQVQLINYNASGPSSDDAAMKADAVKIANDIKAFAVIEGSPDSLMPNVLAKELAQRGVVCICTVSLSSAFYNENPPYMFGNLPTSDEYAIQMGEYIGKRLANRKAKWAGDPALQQSVRRFGLLYITGAGGVVDPEGIRARKSVEQQLSRWGVGGPSTCTPTRSCLAAEVGYTYEPGQNQTDVTNAIAQMKNAHVTTVLMLVDPLYPILFTQNATSQAYFPEWFITGSGLTDTTAAGRLYDQTQWRHAFGISPLAITWEHVSNSAGYREYHHAIRNAKAGDEGVLINIYAAFVGDLFTGIQMAGPILTPDSFARGMFAYPPTGGKPAAPLVYWTRQYPTAAKDFMEVYYDASRSGPDERGQQGRGEIMKMHAGRRYRPGQWPTTEPDAFGDPTAIAVSDHPPGGGDPPHEQDGHYHVGACMSCPGFRTVGGRGGQ